MWDNHTADEVAKAIFRWLEIRHEWDDERLQAATSSNHLQTDAWHSGLIGRLLAGKPPLPKPPPLRHSGPWYDLVDEGSALLSKRFDGITELTPSNSILTADSLLLVGGVWVIEDRYTANGAPAWKARWPGAKARSKPFAPAPWRITVEYAGMQKRGSRLTHEAQEAYRRREPRDYMTLLRPEELPSGRPATVPMWHPCYRVTLVDWD